MAFAMSGWSAAWKHAPPKRKRLLKEIDSLDFLERGLQREGCHDEAEVLKCLLLSWAFIKK
jgi:hypothetical protein